MSGRLRPAAFESDSGCPDLPPEDQRKWIARMLEEVIELAEALPYEPAPRHDLPARPIHR